jgi:hypothetical protein
MNTLLKALPVVAVLEVAALALSGYAAAPARDGDPVLVGTVWKGKLTQKGEFMGAGGAPPEFDCAFTVTRRDGEKFEADLFEKTPDLELTYIVRGTVTPADPKDREKGYKIEWTSVGAKDVKNTAEILKIPYTGTVTGKKLKGTWKVPANDDGTTLEGDFEFELTKKEEK